MLEREGNGLLEVFRTRHEAGDHAGLPGNLEGVEALGLDVDVANGTRVRSVAGFEQLQPRRLAVRQRLARQVGGAYICQRHAEARARFGGQAIDAGGDHRNLELHLARDVGCRVAGVAIGVDHQARQIGRQQHQVVEGGVVVLGEGVGLGAKPLLEDRNLRLDVGHRCAGHHEDVLARLHRIIRRAGLGIAAIAAGGLFLRGHVIVSGLDLGEGRRIGAKPVECLVTAREDFPVDVLSGRNVARAIGRAVGQRLGDAIKERLHVMRGAVAVHHGHHDGGAAEGAVTRREDLRVFGAHRVPVGLHAVAGHQAVCVEFG